MAHMVQTMAYTGAVPWHGLGANVDAGATIEQWLQASGLTWQALLLPITYTKDVPGTGRLRIDIPGRKALVRDDNGYCFDVVSDRYQPVQPAQILEFFRDLVSEQGMHVETAGALKGGNIVWALAKNGQEINIRGDRILPYVLLSTSFDGSQATRASFTSVRVVCNNTLRMSYSRDRDNVSVRHSTTFDERSVKEQLGLLDSAADEFEKAAQALAQTAFDTSQSQQLLRELFGVVAPDRAKDGVTLDNATPDDLTTQSRNVVADAWQSVLRSPGSDMVTARGTAWGVLQGVTHYVDHQARARSQDNRLSSAWFGKGDSIKSEAFARLMSATATEAYAPEPTSNGAFAQLLSSQFQPAA